MDYRNNYRLINLKSILYVLSWVSYILIFAAKKNGISLPYFFQCYYTDILAIPLVLGVTNFLLKKYTAKEDFKLSLPKILFACIYFSILFEWILPASSSNYTRDILDVFCYFVGGGIYYYVSNHSFNKRLDHASTV